MINCVGLLTAEGMDHFYQIFKDWENQDDPDYTSQWPDRPFRDRPNVTNAAYAQELESVSVRGPLHAQPTNDRIAWFISFQHDHKGNRGLGDCR